MAFEQSKWVWMDGRIVPWFQSTVHVSAHALHYGTGVFEGIRCYETDEGPAVFRLDAHLGRLCASADFYGMKIPYTQAELSDAVCEVIRCNGFSNCYVRPLCYYGSGGLGLDTRSCPVGVSILAWPWETLLGAEGLKKGVRVTVSPWVKFDSRMMPTTVKACGQYVNSVLAARDAVSLGFDEALLLDTQGNVAEGPGENLFILRHGKLITNDERSSILLGVTRATVIEIARDLGYAVEIGVIRLDDLLTADEAFFTGTAAEVTPIREVSGVTIGCGSPGPVTERIQQTFFAAICGEDSKYRGWLHFVAPQVLCLNECDDERRSQIDHAEECLALLRG